MIKETIGCGKTIEEAKDSAIKALGVDVDNVEFELIQQPSKKVLGFFGGKLAKVKAKLEVTTATLAEEYLRSILNEMNINNVEIKTKASEDKIEFNISGEDIGYIIGRRGETLDALQYLVGLVANGIEKSYCRVTINIGSYREKREKTLEALGKKMAFKALKMKRKYSLEPMNPYERRIVHTAIQDINGVMSWSEGEGVNRHIVIGLKNNRPENNKREYNNSLKNNTEKNDFPKKEVDTDNIGKLYGKI